jgi:ribosome maturation factor RimP
LCAVTDLRLLIRESIEPLVKGMGFDTVELRVIRGKRFVDVELIVYRHEGVSIENCAEISRIIEPRLELLPECNSLVLKVSSPGIDRMFKSNEEYAIFKGHGVKLLFPGESEWARGIIGEVSGAGFTFISGEKSRFVEFQEVKKARLADIQGGFN